MVFVGTPPTVRRCGVEAKSGAVIDPLLPVARSGTDKKGRGLFNSSGYSYLSEYDRATYLEWLATGRSDASFDHRYMLLYFYGLERRFALDKTSEAEKHEILEEAQRLKDLYSDKIYVQIDLERFIELGKLSLGDTSQIGPVFDYRLSELPLSQRVALGARVRDSEPLSADWALCWLLCNPKPWLRYPAYLFKDEFQALFKLRFDERYQRGLAVRKPRNLLVCSYEAASQEFVARLKPKSGGKLVPDVSWLTTPVKVAKEIAADVLDELRDYMQFETRGSRRRGSPEARALLPREILSSCLTEELKQLRTWARGIVDNGGFVPVGEIVARHEGRQIKSINKNLLMKVADALAQLGFGFVPDPRFALRSPKVEEFAKIFELGGAVNKLEDASETYRVTLINIALGAFVAHGDGEITEGERKSLSETVSETENLAEHERRRLRADLDWMLAFAPSRALLSRKLKELKPYAVPAARTVLYSIANADRVVRPRKVAVIKKFYKALGLDPALAYSDLRISGNHDRPAKARFARSSASSEAGPAEDPIHEVTLDAERIASIHSDTDRVFSVLGEIFNDKSDELKSKGMRNMHLPGLDAKHAELIKEIVEKDRWTDEEFQELCTRHSFMASGAIENINEWAFENYGDALLDEHDGYEVNADVANGLKKAFESDSSAVPIETM